MAIKEIKGNLIGLCETGKLYGMAHGCNCLHAMGSGIAGQLARRYPIVPLVDREDTVYGDTTKLGTYTTAVVAAENEEEGILLFDVFNLYTQAAPSYDGSDVFEYEKFAQACNTLRTELEGELVNEDIIYKLGFPQIGAGLAGGDWPTIRDTIIAAFATSNIIDVYLVEWDGSDLPPAIEQVLGIEF